MATTGRRQLTITEIQRNAEQGIIDEPEILAPPYDAAGDLTPEGAAWLDDTPINGNRASGETRPA